MASIETHAGPDRVQARERIAVNAGAALLGAGLLLVVAVLPAEYGVDPLGVGRRLGLTAMSDVQRELDAFEATKVPGGGASRQIDPLRSRHLCRSADEFPSTHRNIWQPFLAAGRNGIAN